MAIVLKSETPIARWISYIDGTYSSTAKGEVGDLLVVVYMSSSVNVTISPSSWKWVDAPNKKSTSNNVNIAYKQLTAKDLSTSITIANGYGGMSLLHFSKCRIVTTGINDYGVPTTLKVPGDNVLLQANNGDNWDAIILTEGFTRVTNFLYGNGYTLYRKDFKDTVTYHPGAYSNMNYHPAWGERLSYIVITEGADVEIKVASSDDGINFGEYETYDSSKLPSNRYLKFKAIYETNNSANEYTYEFEFDQSEKNKQKLNEFLQSVGTNIKPVTLYKESFEKESEDSSTGQYFQKTIDRSKYKKITAIISKEG